MAVLAGLKVIPCAVKISIRICTACKACLSSLAPVMLHAGKASSAKKVNNLRFAFCNASAECAALGQYAVAQMIQRQGRAAGRRSANAWGGHGQFRE